MTLVLGSQVYIKSHPYVYQGDVAGIHTFFSPERGTLGIPVGDEGLKLVSLDPQAPTVEPLKEDVQS